ncbi:DUF6630 family protein [Leminorella richardii]
MSEDGLSLVKGIMSTATKMAYLLNSDKEYAEEAVERFSQLLEEHIDEVGEDDFIDSHHEGYLGYSLATFIDEASLGNSFMVDWKDTESALDWLDSALENEDVSIDLQYDVDDPISELDAHQIFVRSNLQLSAIGYSLLGLDTGDDCYREILLPSESVDRFIQLAAEMGVEITMNDVEEDLS